MATIRAVLFDADGVVQTPGAGWRDHVAGLCGDAAAGNAFLEAVFAAEKPCLTGTGDFRSALAEVLEVWRSSVDVERALQVWTMIEPDEAVLGLASRLRRGGVQVALATNQQRYRADYMTRQLGYGAYFDHLLYSCDLGYAKPSIEYFSGALNRIGIAPEEALFLDDHADNVAAARQAGLHADVFHVSQGCAALMETLTRHGLSVADAEPGSAETVLPRPGGIRRP